ncbi:MAG: alpha/beta hydrolase [Arenimonas sp.]
MPPRRARNGNAARRLAIVLPALLLAGCQSVYFRTLNFGKAHGSTVQFDAANDLHLDVYRPEAQPSKTPVVVFFYGGSWRNGSRDDYRFVGQALAQQGLLVLVPDYRKAPEHPFPAFMYDAATAVAWARAHAAEYGGDPSRVFLMGHSAGAQIAALLGTDGRYLAPHGLRPRDLSGIVGLAGPYDFLPLTDPLVMEALGPPSGWRATQPINFVDGDEPPFLLVQGDADRVVDPGNTPRFATRLRKHGDTVTTTIVPGAGHVGLLNGFSSRKLSPVLADGVEWIRGKDSVGE